MQSYLENHKRRVLLISAADVPSMDLPPKDVVILIGGSLFIILLFCIGMCTAGVSTTSENCLFSTNTRGLLLLLFHVFGVDEPALLQHISRRIVDVLESICVSLSPRIGYQDRVEYLPIHRDTTTITFFTSIIFN